MYETIVAMAMVVQSTMMTCKVQGLAGSGSDAGVSD
jgi:hypothetical protein